MRRVLARLLGVAAFTWLEFVVFPGHTYLQAGTQLTVPMLERLVNPGFLSRDLVATHPTLEYTVYDEVTLFLHEGAGLSLKDALTAQQIASRAALILGVLLLALSAGMSESLALLIAACVNLGATLAGPHVMLVETECVPAAVAWALILLATGLLARAKPLLAGLAGGLALLYEPVIAAPFWLILIVALIVDRPLRRLLRPSLTILAIFALLLANLSQLQPGIAEQQTLFQRLTPEYTALQQFRTPYEWVSLWSPGALWSYLALWICGIWATARIWPALNRQARWLFVALPACGILSLPLSYLLLDHLRWSFVSRVQPARWLLFPLCLSSIACWIAGVHAARKRKVLESALWFVVPFALAMHAEVLELLRPKAGVLEKLGIVLLLACIAGLVLRSTGNRRLRPISLVVPVIAMGLLSIAMPRKASDPKRQHLAALAGWVERNTWGSSMFLFPDAGTSGDPGLFRALSQRPVWVDWNSGALVPCFESFAAAWWDRWQQTMQPGYSPQRLQANLALPIDYYVLSPANRLAGIEPVFTNEDFLIYDANDLRNAKGTLRSAAGN